MIRPVILLTLGLTLALGCGRADRPTVRQTSMGSQDESPSASPNPPQAPEEECPGSSLPHRTRPKRKAADHVNLADAVHAKPTEAARPTERRDSKRPDGKPAGTGDTRAAKLAAAKAVKTAPTTLANADVAKPAKTGAAAPPKAAGRDTAKIDTKEVRIGAMCLVAPKNWMRERPPINFILAQFNLPRAAGDKADAQLTVTAPGEHDPKAIERVREQLKEEPEEGSIERLQIAGNEVVLVDSTGDYDDGSDEESDPSSPAAEGRYRALNAMVFLGGKVYVVNCTGPEKTVGERAGEFRAFLQTMKSADQP